MYLDLAFGFWDCNLELALVFKFGYGYGFGLAFRAAYHKENISKNRSAIWIGFGI